MERTPPEILEGLGTIIGEITGVSASEVTPEKRFTEDFDADSLSMVEIAVAATDMFGVEIPGTQLRNLVTIQDVIDYMASIDQGS
jgi:acyl carrier protein